MWRWKRRETGALDAEEDTEGEQAQEAEDDADANMSDWNEEEHAPTIRSEVEKAWSKLTKVSKQKNTKSEWVSKNVAARKLVSMEEHRKSRSRAIAVARADKKKQERVQLKRAEMQKEQEKKQPEEPAAEATTERFGSRKTQVWLLEFEIARVRKYTEECMTDVATAIKGMTAVTNFQYGMKEQGEMAIVKLHAKMCQGLKGIEALTAGAKILACVGDTEDGDSEELTEWLELLQTNNELRENLHEGVATQRRKELNDAARRGTVYAVGIRAVYTTSTAAMHVAF
jgi:hypothetical protein